MASVRGVAKKRGTGATDTFTFRGRGGAFGAGLLGGKGAPAPDGIVRTQRLCTRLLSSCAAISGPCAVCLHTASVRCPTQPFLSRNSDLKGGVRGEASCMRLRCEQVESQETLL